MTEPGAEPRLSVVIPTRDRSELIVECLERLALAGARDGELPVEVLIADDGSKDGTAELADELLASLRIAGEVLPGSASGPAVARNRAIDRARGNAVLFLGDDVRAAPGLLRGHLAHHSTHPDRRDALLGLVVPAPPLDRSPFIRWLHTDGVQFGYGLLRDGELAPPSALWTANVSVKTALLEDVGGFDEGFDDAACEDAELGLRLGRAGMRLTYDSATAAEHFHPTDLAATLTRMRRVGRSYRRLIELAPDFPSPNAPGARHHLKAQLLRLAWLSPARPMALRQATWRFLCDEVLREEMWGRDDRDGLEGLPSIGRSLAELALRDSAARPILAEDSGTARASTL